MSKETCDVCAGPGVACEFSESNPFVEYRMQRPSDHTQMCCTMAGHAECFLGDVRTLPEIGTTAGVATPEQWETWIESDAAKRAGYTSLS